MTAEKFEDLEIWQLSRELYSSTNKLLKNKVTDDFLKQHVKRTAISVVSNIAEGFERETNKEFVRFLYIARGSCGEYRAQLYLLLDQEIISKEKFDGQIELSRKISAKISSLIKYLKQTING